MKRPLLEMMSIALPSKKQRGRTLIELLVAIALSLLILLGVGTLYLGSSQTSRVSSGTATIEETGQILLSFLGRSIRRAGYSEIVGTEATLVARGNLFLYGGPSIRGCDVGFKFGDIAANDFSCIEDATQVAATVAVWFQGDSRLASSQSETTDCLGAAAPMVNTNPDHAGLVAQIPLVRNIYFLDGAGNFQCLGNGGGGAHILASNVEDFRIYYGFDDLNYTIGEGMADRPSARSIKTAAEISDMSSAGEMSPWDFVVSVHVCLLLKTQENGLSAADGTVVAKEFRPCPASTGEVADGAPMATLPTDGAIRRSYVQVFTVRSRSAPNATSL